MFDRHNLDLGGDSFKYANLLVENKEKLLLNALIKYTGLPEDSTSEEVREYILDGGYHLEERTHKYLGEDWHSFYVDNTLILKYRLTTDKIGVVSITGYSL